MDALENLHQRVSLPMLEEPGPSAEQLENLYVAALRAPDHGAMKPWRFLNVQGDARNKLGELFARAALKQAESNQESLSEEQLDKFRNMPLRAPLVVVAIACTRVHPKVPHSEQLISAGCAVQNMLLAAHAQGIGGMWRTGDMAYNADVIAGLGLTEGEEIVGYLYLGTPSRSRKAPQLDIEKFVSDWA